ncbi:DUF4197 domain-containing protein [Maricaulis sp.]|uniref:DUF4197 domain-containing protein n=1 Tax=Maricaulis sp. TaxID=1486257 RepID=UPI003A94FF21
MLRRQFIISTLALTIAPAALAQNFGRLSQTDARSGIRAALETASRLATQRLGRADGFFGDPAVHIPLPRQLASLQRQLSRVGMSGPVDDLELRINRSAEAAMPAAGRIFTDAVQSISLNDAISIVRGGDTAATDYLRGRSENRLTTLLRPSMENALTGSGAYRAVDAVEPQISRGQSLLGGLFGNRSATGSLRDTVTDHAVGSAIDGVFHYIGQEERAIRQDPVQRGSDILRRVFG